MTPSLMKSDIRDRVVQVSSWVTLLHITDIDKKKSFIRDIQYKCLILGAPLNISTRHQTMSGKKLCPTKATSQRAQLSGMKSKNIMISYRRLKTQKHLVSIDLPCSSFSFYELLIDNLLMQFFYMQNVKCVSVKSFHSDTLFFALLGSASPLKKCYSFFSAVTTQHQKLKEV